MEFCNGEAWREKVEKELKPLGITCLNPYKKPFVEEIKEDDEKRARLKDLMDNGKLQEVHDWMKVVRRQDLKCCDIADFLIFNISPQVMSWGTAEELSVSVRNRRPLFIVIEGGKNKCPLWVTAMVPVSCIYNTLDEVLDTIKKIDNGEIEPDKDRWYLLKDEWR